MTTSSSGTSMGRVAIDPGVEVGHREDVVDQRREPHGRGQGLVDPVELGRLVAVAPEGAEHLEVPEHQREGLPDVVADDAQHVGVELVDLAQLVVDAGHLAGQLALGGDVLDRAGHAGHRAVVVALAAHAAEHLAHLSVGAHQAVAQLVGGPLLPGPRRDVEHAFAVLGVELRHERVQGGGEGLRVLRDELEELSGPGELAGRGDQRPAPELCQTLRLVHLALRLHA